MPPRRRRSCTRSRWASSRGSRRPTAPPSAAPGELLHTTSASSALEDRHPRHRQPLSQTAIVRRRARHLGWGSWSSARGAARLADVGAPARPSPRAPGRQRLPLRDDRRRASYDNGAATAGRIHGSPRALAPPRSAPIARRCPSTRSSPSCVPRPARGWTSRPSARSRRGCPARPRPGRGRLMDIRLSEIVAALSHALDVTEGQPMGHAERTLPDRPAPGRRGRASTPARRSSLFYALLLKDAGCSTNVAPGRRGSSAPTTCTSSARAGSIDPQRPRSRCAP